jgi:hypothetical protein
VEARIKQGEAKLKELEAKIQADKADAAIEGEKHKRDLSNSLDDLKRQAAALREASGEKWDSLRNTLDQGLEKAENQLDSLRKRLQ